MIAEECKILYQNKTTPPTLDGVFDWNHPQFSKFPFNRIGAVDF